jgi:hypothetical protein
MTDLTVEDYSEKAIVVRGDTQTYKQQLKDLGGKWNTRLRDGPGWIFSKRMEDTVLGFVTTGKLPQEEEKDDSDKYVLAKVEEMFRTMNAEQRLQWIGKIALLGASTRSTPVKKSRKKTPPRAPRKPSRKKSAQHIVIEESDSEDEPAPRKRLLK